MREIEFRGKRIDDGDWEYGNFIKHPDILDRTKKYHYIENYDGIGEVDPETVGQFTGRYDKNGVKIYEGDIVKSYYPYNKAFIENVDIVMFDENECAFIMGDGVRTLRHFYKDIIIEVIGNIHDNKEFNYE